MMMYTVDIMTVWFWNISLRMASLTNWRHFPSLLLSSQESWVILCRRSSPWSSSWKPSSPLAASWPPKARPYLVSGPIFRGPICLEPSELFLRSRQHNGFTNPRSRSWSFWWSGWWTLFSTSGWSRPRLIVTHYLSPKNQKLRLVTLEPRTLNWLHLNQEL